MKDNPHKQLPVFIKAMEIAELTNAIVESIDEKSDKLMIREKMLSNAYLIGSKIAGAEAADLYSLRMDNATIIKISARELLAYTSLCKAEKLTHNKYLQMLCEEIETFRLLYLEWVRSFDPSNDIDDGWSR